MNERVAIVTAAGRGMGAACARRLHQDGYRLALMSPSGSARELADELGGVGVDGSVAEPADLQRLVDATLARYGRVDALVNNTGHPARGELLELSDEDWQAGLELVLLSVVRACRMIVPLMVEQGGGAIVNISTFGAVEPSLEYPISCAARAGLAAYSKLVSERYAPAGVRINSVLPGMIDSYPEAPDVVRTIPMGRYGRVAEIADTVAFLLSPGAGYVTGQSVRVDGGLSRSL